MQAPAATFETAITLPGDLNRFLEQEMAAEGHQNRDLVIEKALRLLRLVKRGAGGSERGKRSTFNVQLSTPKGGDSTGLLSGEKSGERRTPNSERSTSKGGDSTGPVSPRKSGKRAPLRDPATAGLNSERPTPKGGDSTGSSSKGKRSATQDKRVSARAGVSSPRGGTNSKAAPLTLSRTPTLTLPSPGDKLTTPSSAGNVAPTSPLPSIENRNSKFENPPAQ